MARQLDVGRLRDLAAAGWGVDLHAHSLHSDGAWTPAELVRDAHLQGVRVAALTDHDTVAGQAEMLDAGAAAGMAIVTGIEVTTRVGEHSYHLLCYGLDPAAEAWSVVRANRHDRIDQFYDSLFAQLRQHGYAVRDADVRGPDGRYVKGPISRGLVGGGFAADGTAAWTLVRSLSLVFPVDLIATPIEQLGDLIGRDGALVSVAHPGRSEAGVSDRLSEADMVTIGRFVPLAALEAHHPYHQPDDTVAYREMAARHGLAVTCGSDAHGWDVRRPPLAHAPALCAAFLERLAERVPALSR